MVANGSEFNVCEWKFLQLRIEFWRVPVQLSLSDSVTAELFLCTVQIASLHKLFSGVEQLGCRAEDDNRRWEAEVAGPSHMKHQHRR